MTQAGLLRITLSVAFGIIAARASCAEDCYIEVWRGKESLVAYGHQIFTSASTVKGTVWRVSERDRKRGFTIQVRNGPQVGWYLTADEQGRIYLSEKVEPGSYWGKVVNTIGGFGLRNSGIRDGQSSMMAVVDHPSTYTEEDGKQYKVYELRLNDGRVKVRSSDFDFRSTENPRRTPTGSGRRATSLN